MGDRARQRTRRANDTRRLTHRPHISALLAKPGWRQVGRAVKVLAQPTFDYFYSFSYFCFLFFYNFCFQIKIFKLKLVSSI
jgi:hypothetical protein